MRLGVLGTMVWDTIDHPDAPRVQRWGGISYSLAAAAAALPEGATVRPIMKVGADLADAADAFLRTLPNLERSTGVVPVDEPNNRVHLRYGDRHHRHETLTGGVPGWDWDELEPRVAGLDGLFVNLISGFELSSETAARLRSAFPGPLYVDLHSLLLGVTAEGGRFPRPLEDRDAWLDTFHVLQANQEELALVAGDDDPDTMIADLVRRTGAVVLTTRGPEGAAWCARSDGIRPWTADAGPARTGTVGLEAPWAVGDPTGCGDVWGATCFVALMRDHPLTAAMAAANRAARLNVFHQGADGLYDHLRSAA